ncbi:hypothetical protein [Actinomadura rubrisoli]|uniref:Uncharacterized protein n=1 Tax=Actinomadura rubrisoli TaxID=2530368 RepID=A0A4V2YXB9_9ACTN|nr:hypothetical protein [Actinomadura rubrisoli]TDD88847.1 hypothetical protein E1298_14695 [Actinomadura rubrisoli]
MVPTATTLWRRRNFPEIDHVVRREGEAPLRSLLEALALPAAERAGRLAAIPGLCWRDESGTAHANPEGGGLPGGADFPPMDQAAHFMRRTGGRR